MKITHENLLENGWNFDETTMRYIDKNDPYFVLFLSKDYGIDDNYQIKLIKATPHVAGENIDININCITIADLKALRWVFYKATAVGLIKQLLINY